MSKELIKRIIAALILIPLILYCFIYGGIAYLVMTALCFFMVQYEWTRMAMLKPDYTVLLSLVGFLYFIACAFSLVIMRFGEADGMILTTSMIVAIWVSDIFAYVFGKLIGGPKLAPKVSPNKTWSGAVGALACPVLFYMAVVYFGLWDISYVQAGALGVTIGLTGQAGDLIVSRMKRYVGVKDTGTLIPGHGGLLDRIDAFIFATPIYFVVSQAVL